MARTGNRMKSLIVSTNDNVEDFEIEEHVAKHNRFFQLTHLTLDDLDAYAKPFAALWWAANSESMTNQQRCRAILKATADIKAINDSLDIENAA
jgi:hypothetical protein